MNPKDIEKIKELLSGNRFDEAKGVIHEVLNVALSVEDRAKLATQYAYIYMDVMNALNSRYAQALEEAIEDLEALEQENLDLENKLQVAKVMMAGR